MIALDTPGETGQLFSGFFLAVFTGTSFQTRDGVGQPRDGAIGFAPAVEKRRSKFCFKPQVISVIGNSPLGLEAGVNSLDA